MGLVQKQARQAAVSILTSDTLTIAGNRVYSGRIKTFGLDEMPLINIFTSPEELASSSSGYSSYGPKPFMNTMLIHLIATDSASESACDILDDLAEVVIGKLNQTEARNLNGVVASCEYTGDDLKPEYEAEKPFATKVLTYKLQYMLT